MKYMKRTLALILALLLLLAGCTSNPADTTEAPFVPPNSVPMLGGDTKPTEQQDFGSVQSLPEEEENPDGLPVLKWLCLGSGNQSDAAMAEINKVLAEKNMPFRLQFVLYSAEERPDTWFILNEVVELAGEVDLITGNIRAEEAARYLAPITDNAKGTAEPSLKNAFIHSSYYEKTTVDGTVYAIPGMTAELEVIGWRVANGVLKDGITADDFTRNYWEMDDVFARIYENNNNKPFLYPLLVGISCSGEACLPTAVNNTFSAEFEALAACYGIDYTLETPTVVNILEMEQIRLAQAAMKRYTDAGYFVAEDKHSSAVIHYVSLHADFPYSYGDRQYIPVGKAQAINNAPAGHMTGISASSENKDAALSLLALMADDLEFRKLLFFGREGKEYQIEGGTLRILPDENGNVYHGLKRSKYMDVLVKNADGIDIRQGCHDIVIENIAGFTEDDTIALTALNGRLERAYKVEGLPSDLCNIEIRNVTSAAYCTGVRLLNQGDLKLHDILIDGVRDVSRHSEYTDGGIYAVRVGDTRMYGKRHATADETYNIAIKNVYGEGEAAVALAGQMANVTMENVTSAEGTPILLDER